MRDQSASLDVVEPLPPLPPLPPARELPRLHIIHLLAWTAATALAFGSYRMQQQAYLPLSPNAVVTTPSYAATAIGVLRGMAEGSCLFVAGATLVWRRRGFVGRLEPGHYLAYEGAAHWAMSIVALATWWLSMDGAPSRYVIALPHQLVRLAIFVWFIRLALRRDEATWWRWAFAAIALAPIVGWLLTVMFAIVARVTGFGGSITTVRLIQSAPPLVLGLAVAAAMAGDWRSGRVRHWSHWVGAGGRLLVVGAWIAIYLLIWLNPAIMGLGGS